MQTTFVILDMSQYVGMVQESVQLLYKRVGGGVIQRKSYERFTMSEVKNDDECSAALITTLHPDMRREDKYVLLNGDRDQKVRKRRLEVVVRLPSMIDVDGVPVEDHVVEFDANRKAHVFVLRGTFTTYDMHGIRMALQGIVGHGDATALVLKPGEEFEVWEVEQ